MKHDADNMDDTSLPIDDRPVVLISRNDISLNDEALVDSTTSMNVPDPHDLIGFTFPMEHDGIVQKAFVTEQDEDSDDYFIELMDGSKQVIEYNLLLKKYNEASDDDSDQIFIFLGFLEHQKKNGRWEVLVSWDGVGYEPTWELLSHMKKSDPISCAMYAEDKDLHGRYVPWTLVDSFVW